MLKITPQFRERYTHVSVGKKVYGMLHETVFRQDLVSRPTSYVVNRSSSLARNKCTSKMSEWELLDWNSERVPKPRFWEFYTYWFQFSSKNLYDSFEVLVCTSICLKLSWEYVSAIARSRNEISSRSGTLVPDSIIWFSYNKDSKGTEFAATETVKRVAQSGEKLWNNLKAFKYLEAPN